MIKIICFKAAWKMYDLSWFLAIPALRTNHRLADGFEQRIFKERKPHKADLWIQAASVGESYLAWEILKKLNPARPLSILLTTNTRQGMEILLKAIDSLPTDNQLINAQAAFFPFDRPTIMRNAVDTIRPKVMVLLETELWPGLLSALRTHRVKTMVVNGRITTKSLNRYRIWPGLWYRLKPDRIMAISKEDAERYMTLFNSKDVEVMPNIKFDRLDMTAPENTVSTGLERYIPPDAPFLVMGSIRQEEEGQVEKIIRKIRKQYPETVIGLFPRHAHRAGHWRDRLNQLSFPWHYRSRIEGPLPSGTVILWDTFGELNAAYRLAQSAFVGGSLAPLGGQNFLEALACGIVPVIGPSWSNFHWVGSDIIKHGLVRREKDWEAVADTLVANLHNPPDRRKVLNDAAIFIKRHQGGTAIACRTIEKYLKK
jgi:3-deoxy-D-manno-octulosonic-acid transferase